MATRASRPRAAVRGLGGALAAAALGVAATPGATFADGKDALTSCSMEFTLSSWSAIYRSVKGEGAIRCDNGQSARVKLRAWAAGLTVGKSEILEGTAKFSGARNIQELYGSYALAAAHAGAVKSADAQALTKGEISMAMAGTGRGVDLASRSAGSRSSRWRPRTEATVGAGRCALVRPAWQS